MVRERGQPPPGVGKLSRGAFGLARLVPVAGGCKMVQSPELLLLARAYQLERLDQRCGRLGRY